MESKKPKSLNDWAAFRFSVIGGLLTCPPAKGELKTAFESLAARTWCHPISGEPVTFGVSTIERWYYQSYKSDYPVQALARRIRSDAGINKAMADNLIREVGNQYKQYPHWSYQLHYDNLGALISEKPDIGEVPSYATLRRRMKERGWRPNKVARKRTQGMQKAAERLERFEVRGFEAEFVHQLWHLDFHQASRKVVDSTGKWHTAMALCILDDCSRLCCHIQWYIGETADSLTHGLYQAFQKRGLPRSLMTDNGAAMIAGETQNGLLDLSVIHHTTLAYSPYQNGKQETFWSVLEGRLLAMLTHVDPLSLSFLNQASIAWVEQEYNRNIHEELGTSPLKKLLSVKNVSRSCPDIEALRFAFTLKEKRKQRRSDGTIKIKGIRFELPSRFRHFDEIYVRYASWDLSTAWIVDSRSGQKLARIAPQDKIANACGKRRALEPSENILPQPGKSEPIPPLLRKILSDYAATGLPPAYIPKEVKNEP